MVDMTNNTGMYQKIVYVLFIVINIGIGMVTYSPFYLFYKPLYICMDENDNQFSCAKDIACQPGQNFIFDPSKEIFLELWFKDDQVWFQIFLRQF